mgnify:CR=1 FL=1|tara:strand:+ start:351 stop:944 length:594 start_codon:yes stop_codon:yes gene_type:complete
MNFDYILNKVPNLSECKTLDIFAREGDWQSHELVSKVKSIEAWDIEPKFMKELEKNLPDAKIYCRDSIKFINTTDYDKFDLLVVDNGLNCYGKDREYCEHFDLIHNIGNVVKDKCFIIFNVVLMPFNYEDYPDWIERRNKFYEVEDASHLSKSFVRKFYKKLFDSIGFKTVNYHTVCREYHNDVDYLYYVGIELEKK